jgi:ribosome maturation protein SDO1
MVNVDDARIAKFEKDKIHFEILLDPNVALKIRKGAEFNHLFGDLLAVEEIYKDAKKGEKASESSLKEVFGNIEFKEIIKKIVLEGHLELTTEQRRKMFEEKRKEVLDYIVKNSINPITKLPHTEQRVLNALEKVKLDVDINISIKKQIEKIVQKLNPILPMSFSKFVCNVFVPIEIAGKINNIVNKYDVSERKWMPNGLNLKVNVPAGEKEEFFNIMFKVSGGKAKVEVEND